MGNLTDENLFTVNIDTEYGAQNIRTDRNTRYQDQQ